MYGICLAPQFAICFQQIWVIRFTVKRKTISVTTMDKRSLVLFSVILSPRFHTELLKEFFKISKSCFIFLFIYAVVSPPYLTVFYHIKFTGNMLRERAYQRKEKKKNEETKVQLLAEPDLVVYIKVLKVTLLS